MYNILYLRQLKISDFIIFILMNIPFILYSQNKSDAISKIKMTHTFNSSLTQEQLKNKYILLEFWATWCSPCLEMLPHINELQRAYKSNDSLIFVSITDESESKVKSILDRFNFSTNVVSDTTGLTHKYFSVSSLPQAFLIDNQGQIQWSGNPKDISKEMINELFLKHSIMRLAEPDRSFKEPVIKNKIHYDSLALKYRDIYNDDTEEEFFSLDQSDFGYLGKNLNDISSNSYFSYGIGIKFQQLFSKLLNISNNQLNIPDSLQNVHFSYCFKENKNISSNVSRITLFHNILKEMHLSVDSNFQEIDQYILIVKNKALLDKAQNGTESRTSKFSNSDLGEVYAIDNNYLKVLTAGLENRFNINVSLDHLSKSQMSQLYNMTLKTNSINELESSLYSYGLKIHKSKKEMKIYKISKNIENRISY